MTNNTFDTPPEMGYNETQDDLNVVVKMDEQRPIHDTDCRHETLIADLKDTIGKAIYHGCANNKCGVGFYIRPK